LATAVPVVDGEFLEVHPEEIPQRLLHLLAQSFTRSEEPNQRMAQLPLLLEIKAFKQVHLMVE
jgi:hypothetical protein